MVFDRFQSILKVSSQSVDPESECTMKLRET
jgi:hypothetical protein